MRQWVAFVYLVLHRRFFMGRNKTKRQTAKHDRKRTVRDAKRDESSTMTLTEEGTLRQKKQDKSKYATVSVEDV
ncbi:hypothetical protein COOONC_18136, partial [Cooperia oncophora]